MVMHKQTTLVRRSGILGFLGLASRKRQKRSGATKQRTYSIEPLEK